MMLTLESVLLVVILAIIAYYICVAILTIIIMVRTINIIEAKRIKIKRAIQRLQYQEPIRGYRLEKEFLNSLCREYYVKVYNFDFEHVGYLLSDGSVYYGNDYKTNNNILVYFNDIDMNKAKTLLKDNAGI